MAPREGSPLSLTALGQAVEAGDVDTVVVVFTDMQGRLQGKRVHARFFLEEVAPHGMEGCNYLLAVDVEMNTVAGYRNSSWETGYGDFFIRPDLATLRRTPWMPGSAMVQCDLLVHGPDGEQELNISPRAVLRGQLAAAEAAGFGCFAGTELEFLMFRDSFQQAADAGYAGLRGSTRYNVDYSILGTEDDEPVIRDIRNAMYAAGLTVESSKGECNLGQHEIAFKYDQALVTADNHVVFKTASKQIASAHGKSLTFMAKYDEREGNSSHIHMSLRGLDGSLAFAAGEGGRSSVFTSFVAGVQATLREFTLLYAPNINSYKRFQAGSFAPTAIAWGEDNRTCALRVVGHGAGLRVENRVPGADVNPYLALAGMLAAGLWGIRTQRELEPPLTGNAYERDDVERVPTTLREARDLFAGSGLARELFGDEVVDHYVHAATIELEAFDAAVTDWEKRRGFERL
ncbi:glutamine synthetase family protein [Spongisporangium articulatum]|uniref:Glutamine synthetase family protein n=1 Tax=Spongisporangium articulatum TaxID=3362603 RepID=A0ABW8ARR7_9ACTN